MGVKKVKITLTLMTDTNSNSRLLEKVKIGVEAMDMDSFEKTGVSKKYNPSEILLLRQILGRWDRSSTTITLTNAIWNTLKTLLNRIG